jgi:hypothetical protein
MTFPLTTTEIFPSAADYNRLARLKSPNDSSAVPALRKAPLP